MPYSSLNVSAVPVLATKNSIDPFGQLKKELILMANISALADQVFKVIQNVLLP